MPLIFRAFSEHGTTKLTLEEIKVATDLFYWKASEPEPADLQWSGQKFKLEYNLLMCYGITFWSLEIHTV